MNEPLLTISIPTYNRAEFLAKALDSILMQAEEVQEKIRIVVSNNASVDNTNEIVARYKNEFKNFLYVENETNIGMDLNISQAFRLAISKYVWVFSDDDILLPHTLVPMVRLLETQELGNLYLRPVWYFNDMLSAAKLDRKEFAYTLYQDPLAFIEYTNYWVTFITGNIVNKGLVDGISTLYEFNGTSLPQLGWVLPAIFKAKQNAAVTSQVVLGRATASVEYKFFRVFSVNFNDILKKLVHLRLIPALARDIINRHLITEFFPQYVTPDKKSFTNEQPFNLLLRVFGGYREFWSRLVPLFARQYYQGPVTWVETKVKAAIVNIFNKVSSYSTYARSQQTGKLFKSLGINSHMPAGHSCHGAEFIKIGHRFSAQPNLRLEAWAEYTGQIPELHVGNDVQLGADCRISCVERVILGNEILIGNRVVISDNRRDFSEEALKLPPANRALKFSGEVKIGDGVLIEDGACVLPGVTIGDYAIVRANTVVTQDVPPHSIVEGNPGRLIAK